MTDSTTQTQTRRTPLYDCHVAAGARMVPFAGWEMPLHYGSQLEEHRATRTHCGLFDVSHMGQAMVEGPDALKFLRAALTRDCAKLEMGKAAYMLLCNKDGGIVDDLIVSRLDAERYLIVVNAGHYAQDMEAFESIAAEYGIARGTVRPCTEDYAMIAVQGPKWAEVLEPAIGAGAWRDLPPFHAMELSFDGAPIILCTTGYTGEPGVELLCPPDKAEALWNKLVKAGGVPCGLAARDSLRLEKGLWLAGQDFTENNNPYEAALGWTVDLDREDFLGRDALVAAKAVGPRQKLVGLLPQTRRIPRTGASIMDGARVVGAVTSGGFSPKRGGPIALGYVAADCAKLGSELTLDLGRETVPARVHKRDFLTE